MPNKNIQTYTCFKNFDYGRSNLLRKFNQSLPHNGQIFTQINRVWRYLIKSKSF